jgi:hypothetical protein
MALWLECPTPDQEDTVFEEFLPLTIQSPVQVFNAFLFSTTSSPLGRKMLNWADLKQSLANLERKTSGNFSRQKKANSKCRLCFLQSFLSQIAREELAASRRARSQIPRAIQAAGQIQNLDTLQVRYQKLFKLYVSSQELYKPQVSS